jgi:hypothetical protein
MRLVASCAALAVLSVALSAAARQKVPTNNRTVVPTGVVVPPLPEGCWSAGDGAATCGRVPTDSFIY